MNKNLHDDIDDYFRKHLNNYSEEPAYDIWQQIDKRLPLSKTKNRYFSWVRMLAAAVMIGGLLAPFYLGNDKGFKQLQVSHSSAVIRKKNNQIITTPARNIVTENNREKELAVYKIQGNKKSYNNSSGENKTGSIYYNITQQPLDLAEVRNFNLESPLLVNEKLLLQRMPFFDTIDTNHIIKRNVDVAINKSKHLKKQRFSILPFVSADHISGRFIEQYKYDNADKQDYTDREKPEPSFTGGLFVAYKVNKRVSLMSGFALSSASEIISSTAVNALKDAAGVYKFKLATSYGFAELSKVGTMPSAGDSIEVTSAAMNFQYISLPLVAEYTIGKNKWKWNIYGGVSFNKLTLEKVDVEYLVNNNDENETVKKIDGLKRTFFTLNMGAKATYPVNSIISVEAGPVLRYGINSINKQTPIKTYPITYGLALGLHINL